MIDPYNIGLTDWYAAAIIAGFTEPYIASGFDGGTITTELYGLFVGGPKYGLYV